MKKYRIITNGKKYRIQKRTFLIFWIAFRVQLGDVSYEYLEFDTLKEASEHVASILADDQQRQSYKKRKWKKC